MVKKCKQVKSQKDRIGFTLIECMTAIVVMMIVMVAIMTFRYYTVVNAERAENQLMAARSAYLLSEAWRARKGDSLFDPTEQDFDSDFQIEVLTDPNPVMHSDGLYSDKLQGQVGLTALGNYRIQIDNKEFWARLLYGDVAGIQNLRSIHILVIWQDHRGVRYEYYLPTLSQS